MVGGPGPQQPEERAPRRASTRTVTLRDVAALAGVSSQTVSRVLRIPDEVAPHTRARVEAVIRESGYVPNLAARNLASNRSKIVATVIPSLSASIFSETLTGLSAVLAPEGYQLLLGYTDYDDAREEELIRSLLGRRPDGICLTGAVHRESIVAMLRASRVPVVETWDWTTTPVDTLVGFSNEEAMFAMVSFLREKGYRSPCFVGSLRAGDHRALRRLAGFRRAAERFWPGRTPRVVDEPELPLTLESGARLLDLARAAHPEADVLVFSTDVYAGGALLTAAQRGLRVPEELALTGFGDFELSGMLRPGLTTVALPNAEIGRAAATLLLQRMRGEEPAARSVDLGFEIRRRESA
ncbi:LacI family DNA-binding transcriptional regulator [Streptomyces hoynatensis]|uniref:LacI family DNA-binding transcriptional regulator n=1 Tax=Streptomyces hoynatensis TaxID=1141874 RepID=A0A3A9Z7W3_9ACTN|nr:LacI family DNA-binding transcriptional regulator [Streptomyces hoynatensis]RKN43934.1 LacI family DNA-binding transcriptional regulator [Streptomyces hoynatensis]